MANTFTTIEEKALAAGLKKLRAQSVMTRRSFRGYEGDPQLAKKGDTINIPTPYTATVSNVTASNTPPSLADNTPSSTTLVINRWRKSDPFHLTDKEKTEIDQNRHYIPMQIEAAMEALAGDMNQHILANYVDVYQHTGTAGTVPFSGAKATDAANAMKLLQESKCPSSMLSMVLNPAANALASVNDQLGDFDKTGMNDTAMSGQLGHTRGFDWFYDQDIPDHTAGTFNGAEQTAAVGAIGDTSIAIDLGAGTVVVGDVFEFAGHDQQYVATAAVASTASGTLSFLPALVAAVADNEAVDLVASHAVNLAFHRDAFAFSTVRLERRENVTQLFDEVTGVVLRLEKIHGYKADMWELDVLYGSEAIRPECAVRVMG